MNEDGEASRDQVWKGRHQEFGSCSKGDGKPLEDLDTDSDDLICVFKRCL